MAMTSRMLPSCFRRRTSAPSTEDAEKRRWIDEQKRLIAEAEQRAGGPDPRWNENDRRKPAIEERSVSDISKMRWMAEHNRSIAEARLRAAFEADLRAGKLRPRVPTRTPASVDAEFLMKSGLQENQCGRRHSEEYYARRREVLRTFKFVTDESEKAGVGAERPSASECATKRRNGMFSRSALGFARPANSCCTG